MPIPAIMLSSGRNISENGLYFKNNFAKKRRKTMSESVYKVIQVVGTSTQSWEDAAKNAVAAASKTLKNLRIAEVEKLDMKVEDGKIAAFRAKVSLSFKYES
jgi:hypothetical protein